jgi:hypothetical protein
MTTINSPIVSALAAIEFDISPITVETAVMMLLNASVNDGPNGDGGGVGGYVSKVNIAEPVTIDISFNILSF